ncbi:MAG: response regulator transcription factor, partial [Clostridiales bacterium]|nr:response regulator transcription factor [Clostridiales bacterium]
NVFKDFSQFDPHLVLMDIRLPFYNGYHWCNQIRKVSKVPILFLSSASESMNIVMAMNMGGDDFIAKPFDMDVLMAKIQALLRRTYDFGNSDNHALIAYHGMVLNIKDGSIVYKEQQHQLTKNEFKILLTLLEHKGEVVSREKLMEALWKSDSFIDENTLSVNVARLRKRLEEMGIQNMIQTRKGMGYIIGE